MAIETIAAFAAKKIVVDAAPVVATAIATTVTKEIIDHTDEITDIAKQVVCAPFEIAGSIFDSLFK
jgi:hypothetical protein